MIPLLQIKDLSVEFVTETAVIPAVSQLNLSINRGEIVAVVGESGSGKSVSALSILKLLPTRTARYSQGSILFSQDGIGEIDILKQSKAQMQQIRGNQIGMIFQEPMTSLNPVHTCGKQVQEVLELHRSLKAAEARKETIAWFEKVKLPDPSNLYERYPHQLSGGQKQRVMIAMAMCCSPSLLICDEPTTALDVTVKKTVLQLISSLQQDTGMGVLFITHDLGVVAEIADRAIVMYKGQLLESGTVQDIFLHPVHPYTKGLLNCRPILHKKGERLPMVSDFMDSKIAEKKNDFIHPAGSIQNSDNQQALDQAEPVIRLESLNVWYPGRKNIFGKPESWIKAVNDVSFEIKAGETLGLVGESGSGKSTLGRAILKLVKPSSGKIFFKGLDLANFNDAETKLFRRNIQIVFQDPYSSLNPRIQIGDAIAEPMKVLHIEQRVRLRKEKAIALLEKVDLSADYYHRYPHEFSGGQRQRIVIARALAVDPSFVVFDESVSALDVSVQAQVLNLINDLKREFGFTVVFISHDLSVVNYISDRIVVMNQGKIEESGEASQIFENPQKEYTQKLVAAIPKGMIPNASY